MTDEHLVAIVSFEGALKREIKRVREYVKQCETLKYMDLTVKAEGQVHTGEMKLTYQIATPEACVNGDSVQAVVDEAMRRHGWQKIHAPKALAYEKIPSDDSEEPVADPDDEIPF